MYKEAGYDEFLAEKIRQGEDDIANGRVISLEDFKLEMREIMAKKRLEIEQNKLLESELPDYA